MEFFNNYLMFKILFDDKKVKGQRMPRKSMPVGKPGWHGSCIDVSQSYQPLRQRLMRRRRGSWTSSMQDEPSDASGCEQDEILEVNHENVQQKGFRPYLRSIGRRSSERQPSVEQHTPESEIFKKLEEFRGNFGGISVQITPVDKKQFFGMLLDPCSAADHIKAKLTRKRSGSLPEAQLKPGDKSKLAPPVRYEAAASLDPKRKESAPCFFPSSIPPTPTTNPPMSIAPSIPEPVAQCYQLLPTRSDSPVQRPVSAMASLSALDRPRTLNTLGAGDKFSAGSSPSLLGSYISASRRQSIDDGCTDLLNEMDSVVLDLGYRYNKPVQYARSVPISTDSSPGKEKPRRSYSPCTDYSGEESDATSISLNTPPPTRSLSREASKKVSTPKKRHPLLESFVRKLQALKRVGRSRFRSPGGRDGEEDEQDTPKNIVCLSYSTPSRRRWRFSKTKAKKMSPPSIFVQNMIDGDGADSDKRKTSGTLHPPTTQQSLLQRTHSYKRSTSAPSPRFGDARRKSNAAEYSSHSHSHSQPKQPSRRRSHRVPRPEDSAASESADSTVQGDTVDSVHNVHNQRKTSERIERKKSDTSQRKVSGHSAPGHSTLLQPGNAPNEHPMPQIPELLITMSYSLTTGLITCTINKARNVSSKSEVFVRVHLFEGIKILDRKQTPLIVGSSEPEFKQAYVFTVRNTRLASVHVLVELFKLDKQGKEKVLGNVIIGPKTGGTGSAQWSKMVKNSNFPCTVWHTLNDT